MHVFRKDIGSITVKTGEEFAIELESTPTAGYQWKATVSGQSVDLIEQKPKVHGAIGGGHRELLIFRTKKLGDATISLHYGRSWEPKPLEVSTIQVSVIKA